MLREQDGDEMLEVQKPWQVTIDYHPSVGLLFLRVKTHTHGSVAFTDAAVDNCGGALDIDGDGYVLRCKGEKAIVNAAREIARMSEKS